MHNQLNNPSVLGKTDGTWWQRAKARVRRLREAYRSGGILGVIEDGIEQIFDTDINFFTNRIGDEYFENLVLTPQEETYLDNWLNNFSPVYENCLSKFDNIINNNFSNLSSVDDLLRTYYSIKAYYLSLKNDKKYLNDEAFAARKKFVYETMIVSIEGILTEAEARGIYPVDYEYIGEKILGVTTGTFKARGKSFSNPSNVSVLVFDEWIGDNTQSSSESIDEEFDFTTPIDTDNTSDNTTDNTNNTQNPIEQPKKSSGLKKGLIGFGLGLLAVKIFGK